MALAFVVALLAFQVPMATWEKVAPWLFVASLLLLVLVLIPHVGKGVNGARRWIVAGLHELPAVRAGQVRGRCCTRPTTWCARWT